MFQQKVVFTYVVKDTGCKILLAQKAFSCFYEYPLIGQYLSGTTASGLFEARLGKEEMVNETGALATVREFIDNNINNVWALGLMSAFFSCFIDTFANAYSWFSIFGISDLQIATPDVLKDLSAFAQNGSFWKVIAFTSALGGNILAIGSMSGLALMKAERVHMWWYLKNVGWKALVGGLIGLMIMFFTL